MQKIQANTQILSSARRTSQRPFAEATDPEVIGRGKNIRQEGTQLLAEAAGITWKNMTKEEFEFLASN